MKKLLFFLLCFCTFAVTYALNTPTLSSPSNGSTLSSISASLQWNSVSGANRYQWQCDTDPAFTSPMLVSGLATSYYTTANGLHYGKTYYWRVRACAAGDTSAWSSVRTFTTPLRVTLSSPSSGASPSAIGVSLEWNSMSGTSLYQWQCDTTQSFDSPILASGSTTSFYTSATGLHYGMTYYWRVRSCTAADTSEWSLVRYFNTPARVSLSSPSNGASPSAIGVSLEWSSMSGTTLYQWQCDTTQSFDSPILASGSTTSFYTSATGLHYGMTYYWRVRSCTAADTSEWSLVRYFNTPARVTLSSPSNGASPSAIGVSLEWSSMSGTTRYQWQCDTTENFDSYLLATGSTTSFYTTTTGLHFGKKYYWRVRSCTAADTSEWSLVRYFNTPARVSLTSPSNGASPSSIGVSLEWSSISGTTRYQWQADTTLSFNSPYLATGSSTSYYTTTTGLHYGATYYWRVRACTAADTSEWSLTRYFSTPIRISLTSPANGASPSAIGVSLEWTSLSGTTQYQWQADTTENFNSYLLATGTSTTYYTTTTGLHFGKKYYWRVRSCTATDTSEWSLTRYFNTPIRVSLTSPSNSASLSAIGPSLEWNSISGTTRYQWQADTAQTFDSPLLATGSSTSYYTTATGLHYGQTYYWRVRACTAADTSQWSLLRTFSTPARITLTSPSNGASVSSIGVSLEWSSMSGTTRYQWQCDTANTFDSPLLATGSSTSYYTTASGLHYGKTYYWRVRSCTAADTSEWSLTRTFTTPARVTLSYPSNNTALSSLSTSLEWSSISGSTRYILQYDVTPEFNTLHLISSTSTSYYTSISGLNYNTTYYWRVCAYNTVDTSEWSLVRTFRTPTLNMTTVPTLVSPADGSVAIPADGQTFTWDAYPNAQGYELEYSTNSTFTANVGFQAVSATSTQLFGLEVHTTYYWRVRAVNGVDFSPWSAAWSFTTANCIVDVFDTEYVAICESELPYTYGDTTFNVGTTSATFQLTNVASGYCDTIHHIALDLTVNPLYTSDDYLDICIGQLPYTYGNTTFPQGTVTGDYQVEFLSGTGCDSTVNLHLTVVDAINTAFTATACGNYTWNNINYTQSGIYTQNFVTSAGCDSIVSLNLSITSILYTTIAVTACESYQWNGQTYNQSGVYTQTLTSTNGCDSVVTLELTITYPVSETISVASCGSYNWNNQLYTVSGTYQQTFPAANGCDSVVTLQLTVNQAVTAQETIAVCESDLPYTWNGLVFNEAGSHTTTLVSSNGCDSIVTLTLTVTEINTDIHQVVSPSTEGYAEMYVDQQNSQYQWINCANYAPIAGATSSSFTPTAPGDYACVITYNGCTDTTDCLTATLCGGIDDAVLSTWRLYPNPARNFVVVEGDGIQQIQLFNMEGQLLNAYLLDNVSMYRIETEQLSSGVYLIRVTTSQGVSAKRVVIEGR